MKDRVMKKEAAIEALREIKEIFDSYSIKFWLDLGTALGAVRGGQIIEWDHDIDLGALEKDCEKINAAVSKLAERGYWVYHDRYSIYGSITYGEGYSILKPGCHIELAAYSVNGEYAMRSWLWGTNPISRLLHNLYFIAVIWSWTTRVKKPQIVTKTSSLLPPSLGKFLATIIRQVFRRTGCVERGWVIPKQYFEQLETIEFYGMMFNIPSQVEDFLTCHYGNWRVPKRDWDYRKEDRTFRNITRNT